MHEKKLNEAHQDVAYKGNIILNLYWCLYVISKLGMIYTMIVSNWIAVLGFAIASAVTYIEAMKRS